MEIKAYQPAQHRIQRPRSVTILAFLQFLQSLALLGFGIYILQGWGSSTLKLVIIAHYLPLAVFDPMVSGLVMILLALLGAFTAFALQRMYPWAWMAAMILQGLGLTAALIGYINHHPNYVGMLISIALVLYLNQQEVQSAFREKREARQRGS